MITIYTSALEVSQADLRKMYEKGKGAGVETRGVSDHKIIHSIYFRDPNGYVIELTAKDAGHDEAMDPAKRSGRKTQGLAGEKRERAAD